MRLKYAGIVAGAVVVIAVGVGIFIRTTRQYAEPEGEVLMEITYSGGWYMVWEAALGRRVLYADGEQIGVTRRGVVEERATLSPERLQAARDRIDALTGPQDIAIEKAHKSCPSSTEGTDAVYVYHQSNGNVITFSTCDWSLDDDRLIGWRLFSDLISSQ